VLVACMPNAALAEYSCGPTPKICKIFLDAKAVFTGKVISVDQTHGLVRLQVQESFKGLPQGTKEVWIDPEWSGPGAWIEDPGPSTVWERSGWSLPQNSPVSRGRHDFG
jgi:hypothetical protein